MSGLHGTKSCDGPMCCWHLPLLVALVTTVLFLCIAHGNGVTGKRKPSRRFQVDAKKILNNEFCVSGKDLMDGAFVEDLNGGKKECKILQYDSVKTGKKSSETDPTTITPVTPPDIGQKNDTTATGGTPANNSPFPMSIAIETSAEKATMEISTSTTTTEETTTETPRLIKRWAASDSDDGKPLGVGRGIILGGNLGANWKKMDIFLMDKNNRSLLLMAFTADATDQNASLQMAWAAPDGKSADSEIQTIAIVDDKCTCFELYFELIEEGIKITLNGNPLPKMPNIPMDSQVELKQAPEVQDIQINADIDKLELNETTWSLTEEGNYFNLEQDLADDDIIIIKGKFFDNAKLLTILLTSFKNFDAAKADECLKDDENSDDCIIVLELNIDLSKKLANYRSQWYASYDPKRWDQPSKDYPMTITGHEFELKFIAVKADEMYQGQMIPMRRFRIEQIPGMTPKRNNRRATNMIKISLDEGFLFDEPIIEEAEYYE